MSHTAKEWEVHSLETWCTLQAFLRISTESPLDISETAKNYPGESFPWPWKMGCNLQDYWTSRHGGDEWGWNWHHIGCLSKISATHQNSMAEPSHLTAGSCYELLWALIQGREHVLASREYLTHSSLWTMQENTRTKAISSLSRNWYDDVWFRSLTAGEHTFLSVLADVKLPSLVSAIITYMNVDLIYTPGALPPELGCHHCLS